ncbi:hypothetical protein NL676_010041 [Syzygium grande]|nr:hypothetical protein NL676_010041 [Syzygium grande]
MTGDTAKALKKRRQREGGDERGPSDPAGPVGELQVVGGGVSRGRPRRRRGRAEMGAGQHVARGFEGQMMMGSVAGAWGESGGLAGFGDV